MSGLALGYLFCSCLCLVMAAFVLGRHEKSLTRDAFLVQVFCGFVWQMGSFFVLTAHDVVAATFFSRIAYIGCVFLSVASYQLVVSFLQIEAQRKFIKMGYYVGAVLFIPLLATNLLVDQARVYPWGFWFNAGVLHPIFLVYFGIFGLMALVNLVVHLGRAQDRVERNKIRLMLLGYVICYLSVIDFLPDYGHAVFPLGFLFVYAWFFINWFIIKFYDFFSMWRRIVQ